MSRIFVQQTKQQVVLNLSLAEESKNDVTNPEDVHCLDLNEAATLYSKLGWKSEHVVWVSSDHYY